MFLYVSGLAAAPMFTQVVVPPPPFAAMWSPRSGAGLGLMPFRYSSESFRFTCWNSITNTSRYVDYEGFLVVYGGTTHVNGEGRALNDVWVGNLNAQSWCFAGGVTETGLAHPTHRTTFTPLDQAATCHAGIFLRQIGGLHQGIATNEVWEASYELQWRQRTDHAPWAARYGASMSCDSGDYMTLTGGMNSQQTFNDAWMSMDNGRSWYPLTAGVGRRAGAMVGTGYPMNLKYYMGGHDGANNVFMNDVWMLGDQSVTYELITAAAPWQARAAHRLDADTVNGTLYMMGGSNDVVLFNDGQFMFSISSVLDRYV